MQMNVQFIQMASSNNDNEMWQDTFIMLNTAVTAPLYLWLSAEY